MVSIVVRLRMKARELSDASFGNSTNESCMPNMAQPWLTSSQSIGQEVVLVFGVEVTGGMQTYFVHLVHQKVNNRHLGLGERLSNKICQLRFSCYLFCTLCSLFFGTKSTQLIKNKKQIIQFNFQSITNLILRFIFQSTYGKALRLV